MPIAREAPLEPVGCDEQAEDRLGRRLLDLPPAMLTFSHERAFRERLASRRIGPRAA